MIFQYWYLILNNWQSFRILPSKGNLPFMGIIRLLPQNRRSLAAGSKDKRKLVFLMGLLMALIGYYLKTSGHTNYFLIEMLLLVFPIMPILL